MCILTLLSLSTLLVQVSAKDLEVNQTDDAQGFLYKLTDKLIDRMIQMPDQDADLDESTLAKTAPCTTMGKAPVMSPGTAPALSAPRLASPLLSNCLVSSHPQYLSAPRDVSRAAISAPVYDLDKNAVGETSLDSDIFGLQPRVDILYEIVRMQRNGRRAGSANTKTRAEVSGSNKKILAQKGTGSARKGSKRAPHMYHGGVSHGPKPRSYAFQLNKKYRAAGLKHALSSKQVSGNLVILDNTKLDAPKTKEAAAKLEKFKDDIKSSNKKLFIIDGEPNIGFTRATNNLQGIKYTDPLQLNVYDILNADKLMMTQSAVKAVHKRFEKEPAK